MAKSNVSPKVPGWSIGKVPAGGLGRYPAYEGVARTPYGGTVKKHEPIEKSRKPPSWAATGFGYKGRNPNPDRHSGTGHGCKN
jgi:hypothetical protein